MNRMYQYATPLVLLVFIVFFQNCAKSELQVPAIERPEAIGKTVTRQNIEGRYAQLIDLSNNVLTCSSREDCVAVPLGRKACGGPTSYVITSRLNDLTTITQLSEELQDSEELYLKQNNAISDCSFITEPVAACDSRVCKADQN